MLNPGQTDRQPVPEPTQTMPDPDLATLRRFAAGDRSALGELAAKFERPLLGLAAGLLGGRQDLAADVVQDAWLRVIRSAARFQGRSTVKTWLYRIVINRCHDVRGRTAPGGSRGPMLRLVDDADEPSPVTADRCGSASEPDRLDPLRRAMDLLKPDQRLLLMLCYHQNLTLVQAAEVLDLPPGTVKSRLHAALEALRATLGPARAAEAAP